MLAYDEVTRRTVRALGHFTKETGLELQADYFELRIHPADIADVIKTITFMHITSGELGRGGRVIERAIGIKVVEDPKIQEGAPKLVCTWEWTI